ncbi:unnamed protein product [Paramecium pentaurelia]|uniref:Uncharacterized protein n=1 Tax=Paramecium pentaurelia TaxID=43138 RepID=A0A8S1VTD1_9CILI|nr:unnamed protein product [Paramecium pentaurelia]
MGNLDKEKMKNQQLKLIGVKLKMGDRTKFQKGSSEMASLQKKKNQKLEDILERIIIKQQMGQNI